MPVFYVQEIKKEVRYYTVDAPTYAEAVMTVELGAASVNAIHRDKTLKVIKACDGSEEK